MMLTDSFKKKFELRAHKIFHLADTCMGDKT